jgi:hypothetical protein
VGARQHLLTVLLLAAVPLSAATPTPKPSPKAKRSIRSSIDDAVEAVMRAHERPCEDTESEGVACFPVTVEVEGPRFSVSEALRRYRALGGRPAPGGPPTNAEMQEQLTGRKGPPSGFSFDPACAIKGLAHTLRGGSNTFYLYRLQDSRGTWPLLLDRRLSREALEARPEVRELLGEYHGVCEAVGAWRRELRRQLAEEKAVEEEAEREEASSP